MLSKRISTWCSIRSSRKNWQAWHTANISKQLMWKPFSAFDQWPKVGLPSHSAPQPVLEASVKDMNIKHKKFLLQTIPMATTFSIQQGLLQGAEAVTQAWLTLMCRRPWCHAWGGIHGFNQHWRGRMRSRPAVALAMLRAMRPSLLWNALMGQAVPLLKEAASFCMARARSGATTDLIWAESRTVPRNDIRWLRDSALSAKLTLSPQCSRWLRRRVLCDSGSTSDWARINQSSR